MVDRSFVDELVLQVVRWRLYERCSDFVHEERGFGGRLVNGAEFWALLYPFCHTVIDDIYHCGMVGTSSRE